MSSKPSVSFIRADSYEIAALQNNIAQMLEPMGGMTAIVEKGDRVLLKPNLLTGARPGKECTTRPELVYVVAKMVMEAGGKPFLGDSPAFGTAKGVAIASGYLPWIEKLNLPIIDFHGKRYQTLGAEFNHLLLSTEAMEADKVINLPKIKSHMQLTLTMGVKNLFGCVPGKMKAWWHMEAGKDSARFGQMLVETAKAINPALTIIDGIVAHEGNGPSGGEPRKLGLLGAASNVFALDRAIAHILNVDPSTIPTIAASQRLGLVSDLDSIDFPLLQPNELQIDDWRLPDTLMPIDFGMPRVVKSTFKHFYIRFIKEPMSAYL